MRRTAYLLAMIAVAVTQFGSGEAYGVPVVPGFDVNVYATVPDPLRIDFAPDGTLYAGRDNFGSGGSGKDAVKIHRIGPGGSPVSEFGNGAIGDPDAVAVDVDGTISGTPGAVLVGGTQTAGDGEIAAILPNGTLVPIFQSAAFPNPSNFKFDSSGRMIFTDFDLGNVWETTGGAPTVLFSVPGEPLNIAIHPDGRIFTSNTDGNIYVHATDGTLLDGSFASGLGRFVSLAFGPGGAFGTDLYVLSRGKLFRYDNLGSATQIGSGFPFLAFDAMFGPDGALYVSDFPGDRIWRISAQSATGPLPEPSSFVLAGLATILLSGACWRRRRTSRTAR